MAYKVRARWITLVALILLGGIVYYSEILVPVHVGFHDDSIPIFSETRTTNEQADYLDQLRDTHEKRKEIQRVIESSWMAYSQHAFGSDSYLPLTKQGKTTVGMAWTMLDALDTLMLVGIDAEVAKVREFVARLDFTKMNVVVNVNEAMTRGVGGLLGAYFVSNDQFYARKAIQLANRLLPGIETHSGIPAYSVNLASGQLSGPDEVPLSEAGSLSLELFTLFNLTNNPKWAEAATLFTKIVEAKVPPGGLVPDRINRRTGEFVGKNVMYNMGQTSYYGNLVRADIMTSYSHEALHNMAGEVMDSIARDMVEVTHPNRYRFLGSMPQGPGSNTRQFVMDQGACSLGGLLAVHSTRGEWHMRAKLLGMTTVDHSRFSLGQHLLRSCTATWIQSKTGLAPNQFAFNLSPKSQQDFRAIDPRNLQFSGVFESLYLHFRLNKDPLFRAWAWEIFQNLRDKTQLEDGSFASVKDVGKLKLMDHMNPAWLGSTLKFYWLLFEQMDQIFPMKRIPNSRGHFFPFIELSRQGQWRRKHPARLVDQR